MTLRLTTKQNLGNLRADLTYNVRVEGFEKLMDYSLEWHDTEVTGNKIQRITNGTEALTNLNKYFYGEIFQSLTNILGIIIAFAAIKPVFVLFLVIYILCLLFVQYFFYSKILLLHKQRNESRELASGIYYEGLNNLLTIKSLGAKDSFKESVIKSEENSRSYVYKLREVSIKKWKFFQILSAVAVTIFLLLIGNQVTAGYITVGTIFVLFNYLLRSYDSTTKIADLVDDVVEAKTGIGRMMPIFNNTILFSPGTKQFPYKWDAISIRDANFIHRKNNSEKDNFEIKNLNFIVNRYQKVGIAGMSGGGKSTLAKILIGLYDIQAGEYKIGDLNFYDINHDEITKNIGLVLQESEMFNMTLKDNITLMKKVPQDLIEKAIEISQLKPVIDKLPEGINTLIGEKGHRVSGGERQRIGIARAICKDPQILIFDEATSSLDTKTEASIQRALNTQLENKTVIIIAHRLTTLQNVNNIYVFDKGSIVEQGTFEDLSNNKSSKFYELNKIQAK
jgi:ABC-type multidrug transport system fused ATPase/permease subunit